MGSCMCPVSLVFLVLVAIHLHINGQSLKTQTTLYAHPILFGYGGPVIYLTMFLALLSSAQGEHFGDWNCTGSGTGWCGLAGSPARSWLWVHLFPGFSPSKESCMRMCVNFLTIIFLYYGRTIIIIYFFIMAGPGLSFCLRMRIHTCMHVRKDTVCACALRPHTSVT